MWRPKVVTDGDEPVDTDSCKAQGRILQSDEDSLVDGWIKVCRMEAERITGRKLTTTAALRLTLDAFPVERFIRLPAPPLIAVSSVQYRDTSGNTQTLSTALYEVDTEAEPGGIRLAYAAVWPFTQFPFGNVTISYTAGYSLAEDIPEPIRDAIRWGVSWKADNRETGLPDAFAMLLVQHHHGWRFPEMAEV